MTITNESFIKELCPYFYKQKTENVGRYGTILDNLWSCWNSSIYLKNLHELNSLYGSVAIEAKHYLTADFICYLNKHEQFHFTDRNWDDKFLPLKSFGPMIIAKSPTKNKMLILLIELYRNTPPEVDSSIVYPNFIFDITTCTLQIIFDAIRDRVPGGIVDLLFSCKDCEVNMHIYQFFLSEMNLLTPKGKIRANHAMKWDEYDGPEGLISINLNQLRILIEDHPKAEYNPIISDLYGVESDERNIRLLKSFVDTGFYPPLLINYRHSERIPSMREIISSKRCFKLLLQTGQSIVWSNLFRKFDFLHPGDLFHSDLLPRFWNQAKFYNRLLNLNKISKKLSLAEARDINHDCDRNTPIEILESNMRRAIDYQLDRRPNGNFLNGLQLLIYDLKNKCMLQMFYLVAEYLLSLPDLTYFRRIELIDCLLHQRGPIANVEPNGVSLNSYNPPSSPISKKIERDTDDKLLSIIERSLARLDEEQRKLGLSGGSKHELDLFARTVRQNQWHELFDSPRFRKTLYKDVIDGLGEWSISHRCNYQSYELFN